MEWLPKSQDSLLVPYSGITFKGAAQPISPGSPLWSIGRALLGQLRNRLALGGVGVGGQQLTLPDGSRIVVYVSPGLNRMYLIPPTTTIEKAEEQDQEFAFLFYEKLFFDVPYGYGYKPNPDVDADDYVARDFPYIIGEPKVPGAEYNSITLQIYQDDYDKTSMVFGENPRYGNQYHSGESGHYSWWGSPFGDLPYLVFNSLLAMASEGYRYMPAYVISANIGYVYFTEDPDLYDAVPLDIYRNGIEYCVCPGTETQCMIGGVGETENSHVLIIRVSKAAIDLFAYLGSAEPVHQQRLATANDHASTPWRFNDSGTRVSSLIEINDNDGLSTLHHVEYAITYDKDNSSYFAELSKAVPYYGSYTDERKQTNIYGSVPYNHSTIMRGTPIVQNSSATENSQDSRTTSTTKTESPIAVYYEHGENSAKVVILRRTIVTESWYYKKLFNYSYGYSWNDFAGDPYYWYLSENEGGSGSDTLITKQTKTTDTAEIVWDGGLSITIDSNEKTYHYHYYVYSYDYANNLYNNYQAVTCGGSHGFSADNASLGDTVYNQDANDGYSVTGYYSQVLCLDARLKGIQRIKTTINTDSSIQFTENATYSVKSGIIIENYNCPGYIGTQYFSSNNFATVIEPVNPSFRDINETATAEHSVQYNGETYRNDQATVMSETRVTPKSTRTAFEDCEGTGGPDTCTGEGNITALKYESPSFGAPGWASFGPNWPATTYSANYSDTTVIEQAVHREVSEFMVLRNFKGAFSLRSDPTQYLDGDSVKSDLYTKKTDRTLFAANAAGFFNTPEQSSFPNYLETTGVVYWKGFLSPFEETESNFYLNDNTVYPIGWTPLSLKE